MCSFFKAVITFIHEKRCRDGWGILYLPTVFFITLVNVIPGMKLSQPVDIVRRKRGQNNFLETLGFSCCCSCCKKDD